eukprot:6404-Prymnesium_polylepis.1
MRQTLPDPPNLPYPTRRCKSALLASSTSHLHNARRRRDCRPGRPCKVAQGVEVNVHAPFTRTALTPWLG